MKLPQDIWNQFAALLKNQLLAKFDPTTLAASNPDLSTKLQIPHKGFYVIAMDSSGKQLSKVGFIEDGQTDLVASSHKAIEALYIELQTKGIPQQRMLTGSLNFTAIWDVVFTNNGIDWNENEDGVTFEWGDRYKGMYLPWEIQKMTVPKVEIMNRLCSHTASVPSNLWRVPESLIHRLVCDSHTI